jgi:hypothetical protein
MRALLPPCQNFLQRAIFREAAPLALCWQREAPKGSHVQLLVKVELQLPKMADEVDQHIGFVDVLALIAKHRLLRGLPFHPAPNESG